MANPPQRESALGQPANRNDALGVAANRDDPVGHAGPAGLRVNPHRHMQEGQSE